MRCALLSLASLPFGCGSQAGSRALPNVLLISIDTLRADHLGAYGYNRPTSTCLDSMAAEGFCFRQAYAPAPWTRPSHASLLTGLYPRNHGAVSFERGIRNDVLCLSEEFAQRGFETAAFVTNSNLTTPDFRRGFSTFDYARREGREPTSTTERLREYLHRRADLSRPFFIFAHYNDPHADYCARSEVEEKFARPYFGQVTGQINELIDHTLGKRSMNEEDARRLVDLYDAAICQVDEEVGRLMNDLRNSGLVENTIVVLTSDHGEEFLDHGQLQHSLQLYEETVRVPLIFLLPGSPGGLELDSPVSLVDVVPTLMDLMGFELSRELDGRSLKPLLMAESNVDAALHDRAIFFEANIQHPNLETKLLQPGFKSAVRRDSYKLHYDAVSGEYQLYDLAKDPHEREDMVAIKTEVVRSLRQALSVFLLDGESGMVIEVDDEQRADLRKLGYGGDE